MLKLRPARTGPGVELLTTDEEDRVLLRVGISHFASAMSLCRALVELIKRSDPTALIVVDIDPRLS